MRKCPYTRSIIATDVPAIRATSSTSTPAMSIQTRPNRDRTFPDYGFPSGGFFGTPTFSHFSQPAWESRKVEHKQRGNDGGRYLTHPLGTISYEAAWNYRIINSVTDWLLSPRSTH